MKLSNQQSDKIIKVWNSYTEGGVKFINASQEYTQEELDKRRKDVIPEVADWLKRFREGQVPLEEFKTAVDGINKRNRLWGFRAINGQMFFNVMTKNSLAGKLQTEFTALLQQTLPLPESPEAASKSIRTFVEFARSLATYSSDPRGAPKVGSIPYFLSYFWQIQNPDCWPIYYTSMVNELSDLDIWSPSGDVAQDYADFYALNYQMVETITAHAGKPVHLWEIEHAFWYWASLKQGDPAQALMMAGEKGDAKSAQSIRFDTLPDSYIPPVVSVLPALAFNEPTMAELCKQSGKAVEKVFEERLAILFRMCGYETELLGQGHGRVPDGVAICQEYHYAIIYDAKVRQQGYTMGIDERAIREYILNTGDRLRKQGYKTIYFMVVSSEFSGEHDDVIRTLKIETGVNEVLLVEVNALLVILENKLRNPEITLGPNHIQRLLAASGLLTDGVVREFFGS